MEGDVSNLLVDSNPVSENNRSVHDASDFPQTLVTEKIIFCIDVLLLSKENNSNTVIYNLLKTYFALKKKISVKPPEFECLLLSSSETIIHFNIHSAKDIQSALKYVENIKYKEEKKSLELDKVFSNLAALVELPDPEYYKEGIPPTWVYHVIWLFGRNSFIPTMTDMNPFNFLMIGPYFALDILYIYDNTLKNNHCEEISNVLFSLNQNNKGYFLSTRFNDCAKIYSCFAQFLGHPLMRPSQLHAKFNILDLEPPQDSSKYESDDEN